MNEVLIFRAPFGSVDFKDRENWYNYRTSGLMFTTTAEGEAAAEEAFHVTNAPEELLTEDQKAMLQEKGFRGPSLSVGDIVRVESVVTRRMASYYLCRSFGWEEYTGDRIELLKHLG